MPAANNPTVAMWFPLLLLLLNLLTTVTAQTPTTNGYTLAYEEGLCHDYIERRVSQILPTQTWDLDECKAACDADSDCNGIHFGKYVAGSSDSRCDDATLTACKCYKVYNGCDADPEVHVGYNAYVKVAAPREEALQTYTIKHEGMMCRNAASDNVRFGDVLAVTIQECEAACVADTGCFTFQYGNWHSDSASAGDNSRCFSATGTTCTCYLNKMVCDSPVTHLGYNIHFLSSDVRQFSEMYDVGADCEQSATEEHGNGDVSFDECTAACQNKGGGGSNSPECHGIVYGNYMADETSQCETDSETSCTCLLVTGNCSNPSRDNAFDVFSYTGNQGVWGALPPRDTALVNFSLAREEMVCRNATGDSNDQQFGQSLAVTIQECEAACANDADCIAFMFGRYRDDADSGCSSDTENLCSCYPVYSAGSCSDPITHLGYNIYHIDPRPCCETLRENPVWCCLEPIMSAAAVAEACQECGTT